MCAEFRGFDLDAGHVSTVHLVVLFLQDMPEIEKLEPLSKLTDISLVNNSVS